MQEQREHEVQVPPIMSDLKWVQFKLKLVSTLTGLSTIGHHNWQDMSQQTKFATKVISQIMYFLIPALIIIPSFIITKLQLHAVAVLIPTIISPILSVSADLYLQQQNKNTHYNYHKYVVTAVYCYLWSAHFFILRQLFLIEFPNNSMLIATMIFSIISLLTSASTIAFAPVRQFSASTFHYQQLKLHSTIYGRLYLPLPLLLTQIISFYVDFTIILPYISLVISASFILWTVGWISSFYNNIMFIVNNLVNCLIFGEQLNHSGLNYRGYHIWWIGLFTLILNVGAICANIILLVVYSNQPAGQLAQTQHFFLICSSHITSLIIGAVVYLTYRLNSSNHHLIRYGKYNLASTISTHNIPKQNQTIYKGRLFIDHKQILIGLLTLLLPLFICILSTYLFSQVDSSYGTGNNKQYPDSFIPSKILTCVLLGIDTMIYLLHVVCKQITRSRSKLGCSINPGWFQKFNVQIQRDMFMRYSLKITGALAVVCLIIRIQNIEVTVRYILMLTPLDSLPSQSIYNFMYYIFVPILIYRAYKRSQVFSHWFHITIMISLILNIMDSTQYLYESVFVVIAIPNYPQNLVTLLLISPFTIPKKLIHKNQYIYRIGYILINILTLLIYIITCGILEITMIFGLPIYWCVIPSINCQRERRQNNDGILSNNEFECTNQQLLNNENKNVQRYSKYGIWDIIVQEIPFNMLRNKRQGYYVVRVNQYVILVQICNEFYGLFQVVNVVGLQTQQVTTCHTKQASTIDRMIEDTWSQENKQICTFCSSIKRIIHEEEHIKKLKITSENDIQLTGIITSNQFYQLFKQCLMKCLIYNYDKFLKKPRSSDLLHRQQQQSQKLFYNFYKKSQNQKIKLLQQFPFQFISQNNLSLQAKKIQSKLSPNQICYLNGNSQYLAKESNSDYYIKVNKKDNHKGSSTRDSFVNTHSYTNRSMKINNSKMDLIKSGNIDDDQGKNLALKSEIQDPIKLQPGQLNVAVLISAYETILQKQSSINQQRVYKILKKDQQYLQQFKYSSGLDLITDSLSCTLKITLKKYLQNKNIIQLNDFISYDKNQYLGVINAGIFVNDVQKDKKDIWGVSFNSNSKCLHVKRFAKCYTSLSLFSLDNYTVQAIWNNLRFQILFATNDRNQRYSNQTNFNLLTNLLIQGCQEPFGYASYYSEEFLNL